MVDWVVATTDRFDSAATDEEAAALVELLSRSDDLFYEVPWFILHFIETAPGWPLWPVLQNTKGEWADLLRLRLKNAGLMPPPANRAVDLKE